MKINVSIIIPVYGAVNTLKKSLNSINNQNIIDTNKSIPKFVNFLKKYFERIIIKFLNQIY